MCGTGTDLAQVLRENQSSVMPILATQDANGDREGKIPLAAPHLPVPLKVVPVPHLLSITKDLPPEVTLAELSWGVKHRCPSQAQMVFFDDGGGEVDSPDRAMREDIDQLRAKLKMLQVAVAASVPCASDDTSEPNLSL